MTKGAMGRTPFRVGDRVSRLSMTPIEKAPDQHEGKGVQPARQGGGDGGDDHEGDDHGFKPDQVGEHQAGEACQKARDAPGDGLNPADRDAEKGGKVTRIGDGAHLQADFGAAKEGPDADDDGDGGGKGDQPGGGDAQAEKA